MQWVACLVLLLRRLSVSNYSQRIHSLIVRGSAMVGCRWLMLNAEIRQLTKGFRYHRQQKRVCFYSMFVRCCKIQAQSVLFGITDQSKSCVYLPKQGGMYTMSAGTLEAYMSEYNYT